MPQINARTDFVIPINERHRGHIMSVPKRRAVLAVAICLSAVGHASNGVGQARPRGVNPARQTRVVEGDVYLTMQSGDIRKQAGGRVYLLAATVAGEVPAVARACSAKLAAEERVRRIRSRSSALQDSGFNTSGGERNRYLNAASAADTSTGAILESARAGADLYAASIVAAIMSSPTGMEAHYRLQNVPVGGRYFVFSFATILRRIYAWAVPITVPAGSDPLHLDLDNENVTDPGEYGTEADVLAQALCRK